MHFKIMLLTTFINASEFIRKKLFCQNFKNYHFTALSCPFEDWLMQCKHFYYCNKSYCLVTIILTQDALKNVCINTLFSILSSKTPPYKLIISIKTAWQKTSCGCCCFLCICPGKMAVIDVNTSSWWQSIICKHQNMCSLMTGWSISIYILLPLTRLLPTKNFRAPVFKSWQPSLGVVKHIRWEWKLQLGAHLGYLNKILVAWSGNLGASGYQDTV